MQNIWDELNHESKKHLSNLMKKHSKKIQNFEKHKYEKKLNHLKLKNGIPIKSEQKL